MKQVWLSKFGLSKNIFYMGLVSFFNDISTEMMYPILSIFLTTTLGASPAIVGFIQGAAKATENIFLIFFGWLSDRLALRKPFITFGYLLSCISKGLIGFALNWQLVLFFFFCDRLGKSIRTAPRDVLIVDSSEPLARGRAFGFHRTADTLGAVIGPLITMFYLAFVSNFLRPIFFLTFFPALFAVILLIFCVQEKSDLAKSIDKKSLLIKFTLGKNYYLFLLVSMLFYLGSGVEAFFILRSHNLGFALSTTVFLYMIYNVVYAFSSYPMGCIADIIGPKNILIGGFFLFSGISFLFGSVQSPALIAVLFALHGLYMALTEGIIRMYISHLVPSIYLGTAFGLYSTIVGICMFIGVFGAGLLWTHINPMTPFFIGSALTAFAALLFLIFNLLGFLKINRLYEKPHENLFH